jgi:class 3 adenylate cyclase
VARNHEKAFDIKGFAKAFSEAFDARGLAASFRSAFDATGAGSSFISGFKHGTDLLLPKSWQSLSPTSASRGGFDSATASVLSRQGFGRDLRVNRKKQERTNRRSAAILVADVVGYSRVMSANEEGTRVALEAVWGEVTNPKIETHRGRLIKTMGDGLLVEFTSVLDAVRCASDIQREMRRRNALKPAEDSIAFRIGINVGDIIIDEDGIFGDVVNVAARLEALAEPGGICVSRVVRDQVHDKLDLAFEDLGEQRVKNVARPIQVFRIPIYSG